MECDYCLRKVDNEMGGCIYHDKLMCLSCFKELYIDLMRYKQFSKLEFLPFTLTIKVAIARRNLG